MTNETFLKICLTSAFICTIFYPENKVIVGLVPVLAGLLIAENRKNTGLKCGFINIVIGIGFSLIGTYISLNL